MSAALEHLEQPPVPASSRTAWHAGVVVIADRENFTATVRAVALSLECRHRWNREGPTGIRSGAFIADTGADPATIRAAVALLEATGLARRRVLGYDRRGRPKYAHRGHVTEYELTLPPDLPPDRAVALAAEVERRASGRRSSGRTPRLVPAEGAPPATALEPAGDAEGAPAAAAEAPVTHRGGPGDQEGAPPGTRLHRTARTPRKARLALEKGASLGTRPPEVLPPEEIPPSVGSLRDVQPPLVAALDGGKELHEDRGASGATGLAVVPEHPAHRVRAVRRDAGQPTGPAWNDAACERVVHQTATASGTPVDLVWQALEALARDPDTRYPRRLPHQLDRLLADLTRQPTGPRTAADRTVAKALAVPGEPTAPPASKETAQRYLEGIRADMDARRRARAEPATDTTDAPQEGAPDLGHERPPDAVMAQMHARLDVDPLDLFAGVPA